MADLSLGIDVGGTFTDFVLFDPVGQTFFVHKALTTPDDPSVAAVQGTWDILSLNGKRREDLETIAHGTTLVANTVIERVGTKTGLICTEGFRDSLEIGRTQRWNMYDLFIQRAEPLVPRYLRRGVPERVDFEGNVLKPLDLSALDPIMELFTREGVKSIAVVLMNSYRDPTHEHEVENYLRRNYDGTFITLSSQVAPEVGEGDRTSTAVVNAYVQPRVHQYLEQLEKSLASAGFAGRLFIMLSEGGIATPEVARAFPVRMCESGPAAGAMAAGYYAELTNNADSMSFDLGGTTAKMCLITNGRPAISNSMEVAQTDRFMKGSGLMLKVPTVEMVEIGAGGGSIAFIDDKGLLKVGPRSAGSQPGPACYGFGGGEPTVTDADLTLGYLDPGYFLGGEMALNARAATEAIDSRIARPLGIDTVKAAEGIHNVVNANMADASRTYASEQGRDLRPYALVSFGGAGPTHAYELARLLHMKKIICPFGSGVTSAFGLLASPKSFEVAQSYVARLDGADWDQISSMLNAMEARAREMLVAAGVLEGDMEFVRTAQMRYSGQGHVVTVPIPGGTLSSDAYGELVDAFNDTYDLLFKRHLARAPIECVTWRVTARSQTPRPAIRFSAMSSSRYPGGVKGRRKVYVIEQEEFVDCPVMDRYSLQPGTAFDSPAVVEERECTVWVGPRARAVVDDYRNLVMTLE